MSEAQFKTLRFQPDYPRQFDNYDHGLRWCQDYVQWYNGEHYHSSLAEFTPEQVFTGSYHELAVQRQTAMDKAFHQHPECFANGKPRIAMPPVVVYINPVTEEVDQTPAESGVNFPTLPRAREMQFNS